MHQHVGFEPEVEHAGRAQGEVAGQVPPHQAVVVLGTRAQASREGAGAGVAGRRHLAGIDRVGHVVEVGSPHHDQPIRFGRIARRRPIIVGVHREGGDPAPHGIVHLEQAGEGRLVLQRHGARVVGLEQHHRLFDQRLRLHPLPFLVEEGIEQRCAVGRAVGGVHVAGLAGHPGCVALLDLRPEEERSVEGVDERAIGRVDGEVDLLPRRPGHALALQAVEERVRPRLRAREQVERVAAGDAGAVGVDRLEQRRLAEAVDVGAEGALDVGLG